MSTPLGCIRFRNDAPSDAAVDAGTLIDADEEGDAGTAIEGGDAVVIPPPVCDGLDAGAAGKIAGDLISELLSDCLLRRHFANIPPIGLVHLQECLTAQIGQIMGCRYPGGQPFKYPTGASNGIFCRDMKSSHINLSTSDGDFDAFIAAFGKALDRNGLNAEEKMRVLTVLGATRSDIVRFKEAGPTLPCDAPDAT